MADNWEDWADDEEVNIPILNVANEEQLKRLEERRLVEESDNAITETLFSNDDENLALKQAETNKFVKTLSPKTNIKNNVISKQKENEQKQKELSKKNKESKLKKQRERELYGEADEADEYAKYEDMFY
jgi:hypothetical protein